MALQFEYKEFDDPIEPEEISDWQTQAGVAWASRCATTGDTPIPFDAGYVMSNPAVYSTHQDLGALPTDLQDRWAQTEQHANDLLAVADTAGRGREPGFTAIETMQMNLRTGKMDPAYGPQIGAVIAEASDVFADSNREQPGDQKYYYGNVATAINRERRSRDQ